LGFLNNKVIITLNYKKDYSYTHETQTAKLQEPQLQQSVHKSDFKTGQGVQQPTQPSTQVSPKPFMPIIIFPQAPTNTMAVTPPTNTQTANPYSPNPYNLQSNPNDVQALMQMKSLKYKFLRLVKLNPDILPNNYKYKYGMYNMFSGFSYVGFFLFMAYKTNFAFSAEADKKMLWKYAFRFIGGYCLLSIMCNFLFETSIGPAFDQQFGGMSIPDIEKEISKIKESTVILRY